MLEEVVPKVGQRLAVVDLHQLLSPLVALLPSLKNQAEFKQKKKTEKGREKWVLRNFLPDH